MILLLIFGMGLIFISGALASMAKREKVKVDE